ncbi:MBL fold metallo-hydrolase [Baekduia soli]|uniref:MBL fold metallo-hydrolase n=1 Tax=Baekduia soli TaxID=496014 RepID=A0A5B8UBS8_9ACTN|nr:MBL fold metallo-hydrolase [Baekduia soli]QEC50515.1 MBL fold metallo-hydrolase [Baekduia soli]
MSGPPPADWAVDPAAAGARLVVPGVWRLRLPLALPGISHANAYVVQRDDGIMLADCGIAGDPTCAVALEAAVAQTGHTLADVRAMVATHAHADHLGQAAHVVAAGGAEFWAHPAAEQWYYGILREPERVYAARERRARQEGVPEAILDDYASVDEEVVGTMAIVPIDHKLVEGVRLPSVLGDWEVIETPGHTTSHTCLVQREHRLAITGDLVCTVFSPWLDYGLSPDPLGETLASLDRLDALGPIAWAMPGHGRPLDDLGAVVEMHREGLSTRCEEVLRAVAEAPSGAYALVEHLGGNTHANAIGRFTEVLSHLAHLRRRGAVARERTADDTYIYRTTGDAP